MRGLFIFLACAAAVMLASPFFWSLVRIETSAERVGYGHANGVTQWAWLGPEAPWPDWALRPEGALMRVQSHFEAAPGMAAIGMADISVDGAPQAVLDAYARAAEAAGWTVAFWRFDGATLEIPPRSFRMCVVEARQRARMLRFALEQDGRRSSGSLQWIEGEPPAASLIGAAPGRC
jgi:hypothetical protein